MPDDPKRPTLDEARAACLADGYEGTPTPEMLALYGWVPTNPLAGVTISGPVRSPVLLQADLAAVIEEAKANNTAPQVLAAIMSFASHALAFAKLPLILLALLLSFGAGAVDLDLSGIGATNQTVTAPFYLLDNTTSTAKTITVPAKYDITLSHTGLQDSGAASVAGDYFVVMRSGDSMAANNTAGAKVLVFVNGFVTLRGADLAQETNTYTIQVKSVTNGVKIQITLKPRAKD